MASGLPSDRCDHDGCPGIGGDLAACNREPPT
jgi:hypothetical protein